MNIISLTFFLDEKSNKKVKSKRSLPALAIFKFRKLKNTKGFSGSTKKITIHSSPAPRFDRPAHSIKKILLLKIER